MSYAPGDTLDCQQVCVCVCVETAKDNHVHRLEVSQVILSVSCLCFYRSSTGSHPSPAHSPTDFPLPPALIKDGISSAAFAGSEAACHSSLSTFCAAQGWVEVIGIREGSKRRDISVHGGGANFPGVRLIFFPAVFIVCCSNIGTEALWFSRLLPILLRSKQ